MPTGPYLAEIAGHTLDLGPCTVYIREAQFDPTPTTPDTDGLHHLAVLPAPGAVIELSLGRPIQQD